jgi:hypothetical protein
MASVERSPATVRTETVSITQVRSRLTGRGNDQKVKRPPIVGAKLLLEL